MDYLAYIFCFVLGILTAKSIRFFVNMGQAIAVFKAVEVTILKMVIMLSEDLAFMEEIKYFTMKRSGMTDEECLVVKVIDGQTLKNWKESVIRKMISAYPRSYRSLIEYDDWAGAMAYLDTLPKKKRKKNFGRLDI